MHFKAAGGLFRRDHRSLKSHFDVPSWCSAVKGISTLEPQGPVLLAIRIYLKAYLAHCHFPVSRSFRHLCAHKTLSTFQLKGLFFEDFFEAIDFHSIEHILDHGVKNLLRSLEVSGASFQKIGIIPSSSRLFRS